MFLIEIHRNADAVFLDSQIN